MSVENRATRYETCVGCQGACRKSPCYKCARRAAPRTCETCGAQFRRDGRGGGWRYCQECRPVPASSDSPWAQSDASPCASCAHGRSSGASSTGWECYIEAAMKCRPYTVAALYAPRPAPDAF